jgi:hypothetical protein
MSMTDEIASLDIRARDWGFLTRPEEYVTASLKPGSARALSPASTARQFRSAIEALRRFSGADGSAKAGLLLADDVGLGKTTVAALIAWVFAAAGGDRRVRILAPNDSMVARWTDELKKHIPLLKETAPQQFGSIKESRIRTRDVKKLMNGSIQVAKHSYASSDKANLACDLLIVDEAHRAKGEGSQFSETLKTQTRHAKRVLLLTATPFSIRLEEFERMLGMVGGSAARKPVRAYQRTLDTFYGTSTRKAPEVVAEQLATKAKEAVWAIQPFVIRHGIDQLPDEYEAFGGRQDWAIEVPSASADELLAMIRMDRLLRILKQGGFPIKGATNDPRFHVGWKYFDSVCNDVAKDIERLDSPLQEVAREHYAALIRLRASVGAHSKMKAVGAAVRNVVEAGEKVVLFCHHHYTAQELAIYLSSVVPNGPKILAPERKMWEAAWDTILSEHRGASVTAAHLQVFGRWLASDNQLRQARGWLARVPTSSGNLVQLLKSTMARNEKSAESIAGAAVKLLKTLTGNPSTLAVLRSVGEGNSTLPGAAARGRVFATCEADSDPQHRDLFMDSQRPDTVMAIFNSPFGPEALVVTDRLSEGVDLHRFCRHLVHYELDPSPIRTVQRNGRLRRVNGWGAVIGEPINYAYPAFRGTRDHRLVEIMKKRLDSFSLLLGGVQDFDVDESTESDESWRADVVAQAKRRLVATGRALCVG